MTVMDSNLIGMPIAKSAPFFPLAARNGHVRDMIDADCHKIAHSGSSEKISNRGWLNVAAKELDSAPVEEDGILRVEDGALRRPRRVPAALRKTC
jgi:hypothetical protein